MSPFVEVWKSYVKREYWVNTDESGTAYTYDDEGNLISSSDNAGRNQTFTYSDAGEILTAKSADNKNYEYTYASGNKHRLKSATSKSSDVKFSFNYNDYGGMTGQKVQAVDSSNEGTGRYISQNQVYTSNGNYVKEEYNDRGYGHKYTWDEDKGIITKALDENDNETTYTYDPDDDYLTSVSKGGSTVNYTYNSDNYLTKIATGSTSYSFTYDQFGNVETTKAGPKTLATNTYNSNNGNLKNTVYGNGFKLGYTYDIRDRVTAALHNGTAKFRWSYGADGQVGRHEDLINQKTYQYTYDLAGRLLRTDISDGSMIRMDYNDINLPTGIHYSVADEGGRDVYYTYADRDNLPKTTTFASSRVVTNTYDGLTRLDNVKYATTQSSAPDVKTDYTYRDYGGSDVRTTSFVESIDYTYASGDLDTSDLFYTYGAAGNVVKIHGGSGSSQVLEEQYAYDSKGQVEKHYSVRNGETWVYTYDDAGNIKNKKRYAGVTTPAQLSAASAPTDDIDYDYSTGTWGDLLTSYNGKSVTSDAIGNMTGYDGQSWAWKGRQLESYTDENGVKTSYTYNADGIRTKKTTGNKTTEFFLNGDQILMMKTTEGSSEDIIWFFYDSQGQRVGLCRNGTYMYYLYNLQGDVIAIANAATGELVATYKYDTWGNCTVEKKAGFEIGDKNPFRYRGYYWDEESGMYYLNSRYYSSEFGRFISADSELDNRGVISQNLFAYCGNNPVNGRDDSGNFVIAARIVSGIVNGVIGGLTGALSAKASGQNVIAGAVIGAATGVVTGIVGGFIGTAVKSAKNIKHAIGFMSAGMTATGFISGAGNMATQCIDSGLSTTTKPMTLQEIIKSVDYGDVAVSAVSGALFAPASVAGGNLLDDAFGLAEKSAFSEMSEAAGYAIAESHVSGNLAALQTIIELCVGKEERN